MQVQDRYTLPQQLSFEVFLPGGPIKSPRLELEPEIKLAAELEPIQ